MVGRTVGDTEIQFAIFSVVFGGMGEEGSLIGHKPASGSPVTAQRAVSVCV